MAIPKLKQLPKYGYSSNRPLNKSNWGKGARGEDKHTFSLASRQKGTYSSNACLSVTYIPSTVLESMRDNNAILSYLSCKIRYPQMKYLDTRQVSINLCPANNKSYQNLDRTE